MFTYVGLPSDRPIPAMHIVKLAVGKCFAIVPCPDKLQWITVRLHFNPAVGDSGRRVPCIGPECTCEAKGKGWAVEDRVYVPCQVVELARVGDRFELPRVFVVKVQIVGFTEHSQGVLWDLVDGQTLMIGRRGTKKNGPIVARPYDNSFPLLKWEATYPVLATLKKIFGVRD